MAGWLQALRRRQTLASFDYQWGALPNGDAMLSDARFRNDVERILVDELLCIDRGWFHGRDVLDAGCGNGRWTYGLLRLGARVTAIDASARALAGLSEAMARLMPNALEDGRLTTHQVDLLQLPKALLARRFDLVFSFGVLHHTGDTRRALSHLAHLVKPDGVLFLYLYGSRSLDWTRRLALVAVRLLLAALPLTLKPRALRMMLPRRDVHQAFDTFSPWINETYRHETIEGWLRELGFTEVVRTIDYTDLYLRARRARDGTLPERPLPSRPYWFERFRRRPLPSGSAPPLA